MNDYTTQTKQLIDELKAICTNNGLGNDGNEFKIITQVFLYKYLNDKFMHEIKLADPKLHNAGNVESILQNYSDDDYEMLLMSLHPSAARLKKEHFLSFLASHAHDDDFHKRFDDTLADIGQFNEDIFSIKTDSGAKVVLFDELSQFISDPSKRNGFCRAVIARLTEFSFEHVFDAGYDFFATIFEYLIKDYNKDGGGKYAEYYTPHAVARIMSAILVDGDPTNVKVYDPSAGSGTLLMSIAHAIGDDKCTIYSQDISQKSSGMLRLNLVLNNLVSSIPNVIQGNTILSPRHFDKDGKLLKFDYIVSNPPFNLDFSDFRADLDTPGNNERFFAGIPVIPPKKKESMAIYLLFIQHIMHSLAENGKAAIVVPTGFLTASKGIGLKIRERMIEKQWLRGVVSMPSNIFANTGTNVSVIFLDKTNRDTAVLIDASKLGTQIKDGKKQKTVLSAEEEQKIISTFRNQEIIDDFSVVLSYSEIKAKNCSFAAGQYFDIKIDYVDITAEQFEAQMTEHLTKLNEMFRQSHELEKDIMQQLEKLNYE